MLFDETLIELSDTDIGFYEDILLDTLKWFVMKKNSIFSTSTHLENQFMCQSTLFKICRR